MTYRGGGRSPWHDRPGLGDPRHTRRLDGQRTSHAGPPPGVAAVTCFLTGFPGFLGSAMAEQLLDRHERVHCLVQPQYLADAGDRAKDIAGSRGGTGS